MSGPPHKETRELIERMIADGWEDLGCSRGHWKLRWPGTGQKVSVPGSPSDHRSLANTRSKVSRIQRGVYPWGRRRNADT
jgi:hypothetical protein